MFRKIASIIRNMRLRNQLILLASIEVMLIFLLILSLNIIHMNFLKNYFSLHSNQIFKDTSYQIQSNIIYMEKSYLDKVFFLNGNALISFHRLYHATKEQVSKHALTQNENFQMYYGGTTQIPDPLRIIKGYGNFDISYSFMCYSNLSAYSNPKSIDELIGIKMQEQIQSYGQLIQVGKTINQYFIYSYIVKEKTTSIYPCLNRQQGIYNYKPEQRDWFIELKRNYESKAIYDSYNYTFTKPFLLFTEKQIGLSTAMPIVNKNLEMIGGVGSIFLGNEFIQRIKQNEFGFQVVYLVSDQGIMIMHPYKNAEMVQPFYIFNETITGFNITDWIQIQSKTGESSCPIFALYQSNLKCRYNSLYQQEMIIGSYNIEKFNMILIMLLSSQEYLEFYKKFQNKLETDLQSVVNLEMTFLLGLFFVLCFCIYISTQILFFPIKVLKEKAINMISENKLKKQQNLPNFIQKCMSDQIRQLIQAFRYFQNKLELLSFRKTAQCCELENIQFPKKVISFQLYLQQHHIFLKNQSKLSRSQKNLVDQNCVVFEISEVLRLLNKAYYNSRL